MNECFGRIWIITGVQETGKSRFCSHLIEKAREKRLKTAGVLSPPVYINGVKTAIEVEDLRYGEKKTLAWKRKDEQGSVQTKRWTFDADSLEWGNTLLAHATPCDVLIVDELGLLEFERGAGWQNGLSAIQSGDYQVAVVVVRPHLVDQALQVFRNARVMEIPAQLDAIREQELIEEILKDISNFNSPA
jgi:nucleoside-triphosphatase THEP1